MVFFYFSMDSAQNCAIHAVCDWSVIIEPVSHRLLKPPARYFVSDWFPITDRLAEKEICENTKKNFHPSNFAVTNIYSTGVRTKNKAVE